MAAESAGPAFHFALSGFPIDRMCLFICKRLSWNGPKSLVPSCPRCEDRSFSSAAFTLLLTGRTLKLRRHSHQFRQRFCLHLSHHVSALDLHGDFAGSEIKSYLLIELARNH